MITWLILSLLVACYLVGYQRGIEAERKIDKKLAEELKQEIVDLRRWKADRIGKETT